MSKKTLMDRENYSEAKFEELIIDFLSRKYGVSVKTLLNENIKEDPSIIYKTTHFPVKILSQDLSSLEAIVKYLRENKKLSYISIGKLLNRNPKTLAVTYNIASKKMPKKFSSAVDNDKVLLPFTVFNTKLSVLESICVYLKSIGYSYSDIAQLLGKDQRTVWTVCKRAETKSKGSSKNNVETNSENNASQSRNNTKKTKTNNDKSR